jgi:hypothetical protein
MRLKINCPLIIFKVIIKIQVLHESEINIIKSEIANLIVPLEVTTVFGILRVQS